MAPHKTTFKIFWGETKSSPSQLWTASNFMFFLMIWLFYFFPSGSPLPHHLLHPSISPSLFYHTHTEIHLQGVCELWCSLPQRCYALTRMATSSHHALFCVEPVGRTSCLSMNGSNLSIVTALVSLPLFVSLSLSFSVPLIDATQLGQIACTHLTQAVWQDRVFVRVCEGLKERKREKSFAKVQPA